MSTIRELVFDWLFNASVQIGLFAILAAGTLAIHRESQSEISTLLLSRDIRPLSGCACLQHPLANPSECGRKGISAAADTGDGTP